MTLLNAILALVAIEAKTKLVLTFVVGKRTGRDAIEFTEKLRRATSASKRFQLTTDGLQAYIPAVDLNFRIVAISLNSLKSTLHRVKANSAIHRLRLWTIAELLNG